MRTRLRRPPQSVVRVQGTAAAGRRVSQPRRRGEECERAEDQGVACDEVAPDDDRSGSSGSAPPGGHGVDTHGDGTADQNLAAIRAAICALLNQHTRRKAKAWPMGSCMYWWDIDGRVGPILLRP